MHLEVQMGTGGMALVADQGDLLPCDDRSAANGEDTHMAVNSLNTVTVLEGDLIPETGRRPGVGDVPDSRGPDGDTERGGDVQSEMTPGA